MPQLDRIHGAVKRALIADGWSITAEQKRLRVVSQTKTFGIVDMLAEQTITAERAQRKIANVFVVNLDLERISQWRISNSIDP